MPDFDPHPMVAQTLPALAIEAMHTDTVTPTQAISLAHSIRNRSGAVICVRLDFSSTQGLPWGIYSGTHEGPDLPLVEITAPIDLDGGYPGYSRYFCLLATVPAGTASGGEALVVRASDVTSRTESVWTSSLLWVGAWVTPPPPPEFPTHCRVYVPLVVKP